MKIVLIGLTIVVLLLTGCQTTPLPVFNAELFSVYSGQQKDVEPYNISPNGKFIVYKEDSRLKIFSIEEDEVYFSGPADLKSFNASSMRWSPDSNYLVFDTSAWLGSKDSDIYLLDIRNQNLKNITDDGIESSSIFEIMKKAGQVNIDESPAWSPNGEVLIFTRKKYDQEEQAFITYFYVIPLEDMEAREAVRLTTQDYFEFSLSFYWRPNTIYYELETELTQFAADGIWEIPYSGKKLRQLFSWEDYKVSKPEIVNLSQDGVLALMSLHIFNFEDTTSRRSYTEYSLLNLINKNKRILSLLGEPEKVIKQAALAPNKEMVLLVFDDEDNQSTLVVQDILGLSEKVLFEGSKIESLKIVSPSKGKYVVLINHFDGTCRILIILQNDPPEI